MELAMKLKHELWEENGGQELTFCLAGRHGDDARKLLSPDAKLIWTVEAGSHFEAMTEDQYDDHRDSAQYRTRPWNRAAVSGGRSQHCDCVLPRQAWIRPGLLLRVVLCQR